MDEVLDEVEALRARLSAAEAALERERRCGLHQAQRADAAQASAAETGAEYRRLLGAMKSHVAQLREQFASCPGGQDSMRQVHKGRVGPPSAARGAWHPGHGLWTLLQIKTTRTCV
jgi:hypothetical protein